MCLRTKAGYHHPVGSRRAGSNHKIFSCTVMKSYKSLRLLSAVKQNVQDVVVYIHRVPS
jgi:hypothetical protein